MAFGMVEKVATGAVGAGVSAVASKLLWWVCGIMALVIIVGGSFGYVAYTHVKTDLDKTRMELSQTQDALKTATQANARMLLQMQAMEETAEHARQTIEDYQEQLKTMAEDYEKLKGKLPDGASDEHVAVQTDVQRANAQTRILGLWEIYCFGSVAKECQK